MFKGILFVCFFQVYCFSNWTVLIYMEPSGNLTEMVFKNMTDMCLSDINKDIFLLIQLHAYESTGIRYKIENKSIVPIHQVILTNNKTEDIINSAKWAFNSFKSEKTMVIFWGHGLGILNPKYYDPKKNLFNRCQNSLMNPSSKIINHLDNLYKSWIFDDLRFKYLDNIAIEKALKSITKRLNKKIDIVGFDTCLAAMLELNFQMADYANYQVSSQNCELQDGWDYEALTSILNSNLNAEQTAKRIVKSFDNYYKKKACKFYTLSAINLSNIKQIINKLDNLIDLLINNEKKNEIKIIITKARDLSSKFSSMPMYIDLLKFLLLLSEKNILKHALPLITELQSMIKEAVIENCTGPSLLNNAHGMSIYFPKEHINNSYYKTKFSLESKWLTFLNFAVN